MTSPSVRVRFAPSPTGDLHVGNARTALFNWLFARHFGGRLVLRIEDTDRFRTSRIFEENLLGDLAWLGIDWDEGPYKGGAYGPYRQSERLACYEEALRRLMAAQAVYPCYCTEQELEEERAKLVARRLSPRYLGRCRDLSAAERGKMESEGRQPSWRFRVPRGPIDFQDLIRGPVHFEGTAMGDFIIVRANGVPAYNFACVVDDSAMAITHVLRGEDHLSNTGLQILLYRALGLPLPHFAHHALILGKDRAKLSKRHGSTAVREFREQGILPEAMINYLALLGASLEDGAEIADRESMIGGFSLDRAGKSGAVFDEDKLRWLNAHYIHHLDPETLTGKVKPYLAATGFDPDAISRDRLQAMVAAVQDNLMALTDMGCYIDIFDPSRFSVSPEATTLLGTADAQEVVQAAREALAAGTTDYADLIAWARHKTGRKGKDLFMPIRAAVTGRLKGPELEKVFALLDGEVLKQRLSWPPIPS